MRLLFPVISVIGLMLELASAQVNLISQQNADIPHYDYIIVGAGISGLGASSVLTKNKAKHLIIEARNRIGGRIAPFKFAGQTRDLGAHLVEYPLDNNPLHDLIQERGYPTLPASLEKQTVFYVNKSMISAQDQVAGQQGIHALAGFIETASEQMDQDAPASEVITEFYSRYNYSQFVRDRINGEAHITAIIYGDQLEKLSAWQFWIDAEDQDSTTYVPAKGWHELIQRIYEDLCDPVMHWDETVLKVDHSGDKIMVTTDKSMYSTNKLMVSAPLGVLKAQKIEFVPELPARLEESIDGVGYGNYEIIYVSFKQKFWNKSEGVFTFVGQNKLSKYPQAWIVPNTDPSKNILLFEVSGQVARQIVTYTTTQLKQDMTAFLKEFLDVPFEISNIYASNWQSDQLALGSFSYYRVGTTDEMVLRFREGVENDAGKIWFIGEHTIPVIYSYTHGAYQSGRIAANEALNY